MKKATPLIINYAPIKKIQLGVKKLVYIGMKFILNEGVGN